MCCRERKPLEASFVQPIYHEGASEVVADKEIL
jgi:hypothetical protein